MHLNEGGLKFNFFYELISKIFFLNIYYLNTLKKHKKTIITTTVTLAG